MIEPNVNSVTFSCQACGAVLRIPKGLAGKEDICPDCGAVVRSPSAENKNTEEQTASPLVADDDSQSREQDSIDRTKESPEDTQTRLSVAKKLNVKPRKVSRKSSKQAKSKKEKEADDVEDSEDSPSETEESIPTETESKGFSARKSISDAPSTIKEDDYNKPKGKKKGKKKGKNAGRMKTVHPSNSVMTHENKVFFKMLGAIFLCLLLFYAVLQIVKGKKDPPPPPDAPTYDVAPIDEDQP